MFCVCIVFSGEHESWMKVNVCWRWLTPLLTWLVGCLCLPVYTCMCVRTCVYTGSEADLYQRVLTGCNRTLTLLLRWHRARRRDVELGPSQGLSDWDGRKCDEDRHSGMLSDEQRTNQPTNKHAAAYACVHPRYEICSALNWVCINLFGGHWFSGSYNNCFVVQNTNYTAALCMLYACMLMN